MNPHALRPGQAWLEVSWPELGELVHAGGRVPVHVAIDGTFRQGWAEGTSGLILDGNWIPRTVLDLHQARIEVAS